MIKVYRKLTEDQLKRGVIFSSCLSVDKSEEGETMHEVFNNEEGKHEHIKRLKDDKFFNGSKWRYNIIRQ